jgi:hypothetical protein
MKQINLLNVNWARVLLYVIILILSIIILSTCTNNAHTQLANEVLKKEIKISDLKAQKYVERINILNDSLVVLEKLKQKEIIKVKIVVKEVDRKIKEVGTMQTKDLALFYQKRYLETVYITNYGIALSDTIAKRNIVDVIERDGFKAELGLTKNVLLIEEKKRVVKDSIIENKSLIIVEKDKIIGSQADIEKNLTKSVKSEKVKKNIWKVTAVGILAGSVYLLAK